MHDGRFFWPATGAHVSSKAAGVISGLLARPY
jgi:hypothetical protein